MSFTFGTLVYFLFLASLPGFFMVEIQVLKVSSAGSSSELEVVNGSLVLEWGHVELICKSKMPIKWEFIVNGVSIPILNVRYQRNFDISEEQFSPDELTNMSRNSFEGRVTLKGLLEWQSGIYSCRHFNGKWTNNSYMGAKNLSVFVPESRGFTEISHEISWNTSDLVIPCRVSNPKLMPTLTKLNADGNWTEIDQKHGYEPLKGFTFDADVSNNSLTGKYKCSLDSPPRSLTFTVNHGGDGKKNSNSCWYNSSCMALVRSKRLECFCGGNSYALFINEETLEGENRAGNCQMNWTFPFEDDWRVEEFLSIGEQEEDCFRDHIRKDFNGTGTRVILRATREDQKDNFSLTITFDGFPTWASGFQLGFRRNSQITVINKRPSTTHLFPLAHYQAIWKGIEVPLDVTHVEVYQPDSFSTEWFRMSKNITELFANAGNNYNYTTTTNETNNQNNQSSVNETTTIANAITPTYVTPTYTTTATPTSTNYNKTTTTTDVQGSEDGDAHSQISVIIVAVTLIICVLATSVFIVTRVIRNRKSNGSVTTTTNSDVHHVHEDTDYL